jgi:hypothetical protein
MIVTWNWLALQRHCPARLRLVQKTGDQTGAASFLAAKPEVEKVEW